MHRPLRILITNVGIANRTGTEIVAMDLASWLLRLGHMPMIWAPLLDPSWRLTFWLPEYQLSRV